MKKFDYYEFTGILVPGAILLFGLSRIYGLGDMLAAGKDVNLGEFGLFVVLSYAAGHIVHSLGNGIEFIWWKCAGGMPSDWVRSNKRSLLAAEQQTQLSAKISSLLQLQIPAIAALSSGAWYSITRQIYAAVRRAGLNERIDIFNGNYGMFRGISASLTVLIFAAVLNESPPWKIIGVLSIAALASLIRMHRFGIIYTRELFVQFLSIDPNEAPRPNAQAED